MNDSAVTLYVPIEQDNVLLKDSKWLSLLKEMLKQ